MFGVCHCCEQTLIVVARLKGTDCERVEASTSSSAAPRGLTISRTVKDRMLLLLLLVNCSLECYYNNNFRTN